ncbi:MAG: M23 family metallopeptidase [Actinomycetota bacterium]|nr:M23 family metallopeptidase [Actinomycetota bacterium]
MTFHRPTARGALLTVIALLLSAGAAAASPAAKAPQIVFPVLGESSYQDDFGDPRGQGGHEGNDIMAPRKALVLAAEAGTVKFHTTSARAGCMLYLNGKSGTQYLYIHLNNDLTMGNDNQGSCIAGVAYAKGLKNGARVAAGQVIGYNGDSGDANAGSPHVHFEVHPGGGGAVNPFPYLGQARRLLFSAQVGTTFTLALTGKVANAAGEDLQLNVEQVRQWPGGRKVKQPGQKVPVFVPESASIEGVAVAAGLSPFPTLELLTKGLPITVWTEPAKVTFAAQSGLKGALAASRVVVKP